MTNLEKYFGIEVFFKKILNPLELSYLEERAIEITKLKGFDVSNFYIYVHSMTIYVDQSHFSHRLSIKEKIKELEVRFCVNPKQVKRSQIKFFNEIVKHNIPNGSYEYYGDTELRRIYPGSMLTNSEYLKMELITYIDKSLVRESFKKIKVHVQAIPTQEYRDYLKTTKKDTFITSIDLRFTREVQLVIDSNHNNSLDNVKDVSKNILPINEDNVSKYASDNLKNKYDSKELNKTIVNCKIRIFISYSSTERILKDIIQQRLDVYLKNAQNEYETVWADSKIPIGGDWNEVIKDALSASTVGILLVSPMFLGSKYSMGEELEIMLKKRKEEGYIIIPLLLRECNFFNNQKLSSMQFFKTYQSEYDVTDLLRKDKLMPFDELADVQNPSERLLNKYFQKFAIEIDRAVNNNMKTNSF